MYKIISDENNKIIAIRANKKDAIKTAYDYLYSKGNTTIIDDRTGKVIYKTNP